jgi:U3 small nucleolar RNA-associated protein 23
METLYKLGPEFQNVVDVAKTFERRRCNHREAKPEAECVADVVGESRSSKGELSACPSSQLATLRIDQ